MRIGELAAQSGVSVRALRHYEALGLLTAGRTASGYRQFTEADVQRVRLIRLFQSVGFRLEEVRDYAPCWQTADAIATEPLTQARQFYERKLADLDAQMADLQAVRDRLAAHLSALPQLHVPEDTP